MGEEVGELCWRKDEGGMEKRGALFGEKRGILEKRKGELEKR